MRDDTKNNTLIVYLKDPNDWKIVKEYGIYRIRSYIRNPPEILKNRSVEIIAFYLPSIFKKNKYSIRHYAKVKKISIADRSSCIPNEVPNAKSNNKYYKIEVEEPQLLEEPIFHFRAARKKLTRREMILFPTTEQKLFSAREFNFLFNGSYLEEKMWKALLEINIFPEREWPVKTEGKKSYYLDFAIFCNNGHFCIEIDGQQHYQKDHVRYDKERTNNINNQAWKIFRYDAEDLQPHTISKAIKQIKTEIRSLHGLDTEGGLLPDSPTGESVGVQMAMFTDQHLDFLALRKRVKTRFEEG